MATATNSRIFGVSHSGAINTISGFTNQGRLHYANTQSQTYQNNYANVFWCNGVDETRFTWSMAYIIKNGEGNAIASTTVGVDDGDYTGAAGTADAYIRFKGGADGDAFIAACKHYVALNNAAGFTFGNPTPVQDTTDNWKAWMDANADYWTNFVVVATTTTEAPPAGNYTVSQCGGSGQAIMDYDGSQLVTVGPLDGTIFLVGDVASNIFSVSGTAPAWIQSLQATDTFRVTALSNEPAHFGFRGDDTSIECAQE